MIFFTLHTREWIKQIFKQSFARKATDIKEQIKKGKAEDKMTKWQNDKKKVEHNVANWITYNQIQPSTGTLERPSCIRWIANSFPQKCKLKQITGSNTI